jgi:hypothetical protein
MTKDLEVGNEVFLVRRFLYSWFETSRVYGLFRRIVSFVYIHILKLWDPL